MTEIDFAYFNYEHVLPAFLLCLFITGPSGEARCLAAVLPRVSWLLLWKRKMALRLTLVRRTMEEICR